MYKLTSNEAKTIEDISKLTITDYEVENGSIPVNNLIEVIKDLWERYEGLDDDHRALERYINENYRPEKGETFEYGE